MLVSFASLIDTSFARRLFPGLSDGMWPRTGTKTVAAGNVYRTKEGIHAPFWRPPRRARRSLPAGERASIAFPSSHVQLGCKPPTSFRNRSTPLFRRSLQIACLSACARATTGRCHDAPPIGRPPRRLTALLPPAPNSQNGTDAIFRSFGLLVTRHLSLVTAFLIATPRN